MMVQCIFVCLCVCVGLTNRPSFSTWNHTHIHTHILSLLQTGPSSLIITHSHPCLLSARRITPNTQPEKERHPHHLHAILCLLSIKFHSAEETLPACTAAGVRSSCHPEFSNVHIERLCCFGFLGAVTRCGLIYCDVLMFAKIGTVFWVWSCNATLLQMSKHITVQARIPLFLPSLLRVGSTQILGWSCCFTNTKQPASTIGYQWFYKSVLGYPIWWEFSF